jgi:hypothetical protein
MGIWDLMHGFDINFEGPLTTSMSDVTVPRANCTVATFMGNGKILLITCHASVYSNG